MANLISVFAISTTTHLAGIGGAISSLSFKPQNDNCIFNTAAGWVAIKLLRHASPTQINANLLVIDNYAAFFGGHCQ